MGETILCFMYDIKISMTLKWWKELLLVLHNNGWNHSVFYVWYQDKYDIKMMNRIIIRPR